MNVLVLNARGLHVGYLGCYGNEWVQTPTLDRLAAEGVVFDRHLADCLAADHWRSAWTGTYHFPTREAEDDPAPAPPADLFHVLQTHGIAHQVIADLGALLDEDGEVSAAFLDWLTAHERSLSWIDLPTLEPPWDLPEEFLAPYFEEDEEDDEESLTPWLDPPPGPLTLTVDDFNRLQNTYAAAVTGWDALLGSLLERLGRHGPAGKVLLCVTADRGLALGEHGVVGPCSWPHGEVAHLPLIVRFPDGAEAGRRVAALTQPVDLPPTLLDLLGVPAVPAQGHSLLPLARGTAERVRAYACAGGRHGGEVGWALHTPEWAFLLSEGEGGERRQLYVKPDDRWEVNNVLQHYLERAERLEETLRAFVAATRRPGPFQAPELREATPEPEGGGPEAAGPPDRAG
jgi:arylsulfatase A-like enzyme